MSTQSTQVGYQPQTQRRALETVNEHEGEISIQSLGTETGQSTDELLEALTDASVLGLVSFSHGDSIYVNGEFDYRAVVSENAPVVRPQRVVLVDFGEPNGHVIAGTRPAIVVGSADICRSSVVQVVPLTTSQQKQYESQAAIQATDENGLECDSLALASHLQTVPKGKIGAVFGEVRSQFWKIDQALNVTLTTSLDA